MKVLLVEDEEFIRDLFKRQLDLSGFTTDAFANGQDGLAAIGKNAYDLVLLDIMLPDINGLQILQNIRSNPTTKGVAVVLLTNLGQDAVIKQGFELGADGYLVKAAYTPDQIVQEVKNIMQKKNAQAHATPEGAAPVAPAAGAVPSAPSSEPGVPAFPGQASAPAATDAVPTFPGQAAPTPAPDPMTPPPAEAPLTPGSEPIASALGALPTFPPVETAAPAPVTPPSASEVASIAASAGQGTPDSTSSS